MLIICICIYHIARNFRKLKFLENSFQWIFQKIFSKFSGIFSFLATGSKNFKAPFWKKIFRKFLKFPKFPKIKFYENFWLYGTYTFEHMYIVWIFLMPHIQWYVNCHLIISYIMSYIVPVNAHYIFCTLCLVFSYAYWSRQDVHMKYYQSIYILLGIVCI